MLSMLLWKIIFLLIYPYIVFYNFFFDIIFFFHFLLVDNFELTILIIQFIFY